MITVLSKDQWKELSEAAHISVFEQKRPSALDRIDFALLQGGNERPESFVTIRELDSESAYIQHGGNFPNVRATKTAAQHLVNYCLWLKENKFKRVNFLVANTNIPMIKTGLNCQFLVTGMRVFKEETMLEMSKEFGEE